MTGEKAERFVRLNLLLMAGGFALVGFFFIAWPDGTLARLTEFGDNFGDFAPAPETDERLWLSLGFAYMVVITFLALIAAPTWSATARCCWRSRPARPPHPSPR